MRSVSHAETTRRPGMWVLAMSTAVLACHSSTYEQSYLRASHNFSFRAQYPQVDALFNAFDFGHAALYERELRSTGTLARDVDTVLYTKVTATVLRHPSRVTLDERAIAPAYATVAPEVLETFEWAHMLHRQLYDVLADGSIPDEKRDEVVADVLRYYRSRADLALSVSPKSMDLMEGQPYSLALRRVAPRYNALIWSYHWLQMALYEALLAAPPGPSREALVHEAVNGFWKLAGSDGRLPSTMPMSPAIAAHFTIRYPEAAAIFDNLHALHDVVGDILATPSIPQPAKRSALLHALRQYQDAVTAISDRDEWMKMSRAMGVEAMGGAIVP